MACCGPQGVVQADVHQSLVKMVRSPPVRSALIGADADALGVGSRAAATAVTADFNAMGRISGDQHALNQGKFTVMVEP
jgi:hypothetical protein